MNNNSSRVHYGKFKSIWKITKSHSCQSIIKMTDDIICKIFRKPLINPYNLGCICRFCHNSSFIKKTIYYQQQLINFSNNTQINRNTINMSIKCPRQLINMSDDLKKFYEQLNSKIEFQYQENIFGNNNRKILDVDNISSEFLEENQNKNNFSEQTNIDRLSNELKSLRNNYSILLDEFHKNEKNRNEKDKIINIEISEFKQTIENLMIKNNSLKLEIEKMKKKNIGIEKTCVNKLKINETSKNYVKLNKKIIKKNNTQKLPTNNNSKKNLNEKTNKIVTKKEKPNSILNKNHNIPKMCPTIKNYSSNNNPVCENIVNIKEHIENIENEVKFFKNNSIIVYEKLIPILTVSSTKNVDILESIIKELKQSVSVKETVHNNKLNDNISSKSMKEYEIVEHNIFSMENEKFHKNKSKFISPISKKQTSNNVSKICKTTNQKSASKINESRCFSNYTSQINYILLQESTFNDRFIWIITNFRENVKLLKPFIESNSFYLPENGFKMSLRINTNRVGIGKETYLSVYFSIIEGKYDKNLSWPFKYDAKFSLLNQTTKRCYISKTIQKRKSFKLCECNQPIIDENFGMGFSKFIKLNELLNDERLLKNDQIILILSIRPSN